MNVISVIQGDSRFDALQYGISEYLNIEDLQITPSQLKIHVAYWNGAAQSNPNMVLASVATHPRVVELLQSIGMVKHQLRMFTTLQDSRNWLSIEMGIPQPT